MVVNRRHCTLCCHEGERGHCSITPAQRCKCSYGGREWQDSSVVTSCQCTKSCARLLIAWGAKLKDVQLDNILTSIPSWATAFATSHDKCNHAALVITGICRRSPVMRENNRDSIGMIARMVWESRLDDAWLDDEGDEYFGLM